ncbi:glycosyltransferase family 2 protein [Acidithiobacillus ferriphilus]|uniref:glycosyltransferase family 2 protein n=1 Tax=Acidithiobacillus ferriphilus TaxID=1689834 RepID=UPI001C07CFBD|nr:glycosyltransferase family 2 protein [Acidithiobacillus ferriphilus]MBU2832978.1 glycosyltransferase family 2 protein [Acidithiobacillus ferriphilus]
MSTYFGDQVAVATGALSVIYITRDAGCLLRASLDSVVPLGAEIFLVDSGSTDDTLTIATEMGVKIIQRPWPGFGAQRQFAVESAANDWILMLDADEILRDQACAAILDVVRSSDPHVAYALRRYNYLHGKAIRHGDWSRDYVVRLFNRRYGHYRPEDMVHESWHGQGETRRMPGYILDHHSFPSYADMLDKLRLYATLNAQQVHQRGKVLRGYMPMTHALAAFWRGYFWRLGFLDGVEGAAIAWTTALGAFMKYAIALELRDCDRQ